MVFLWSLLLLLGSGLSDCHGGCVGSKFGGELSFLQWVKGMPRAAP